MTIHLFTVEEVHEVQEGLRLLPGIKMSDERPEVGNMIQGCKILLKDVEGGSTETTLVTYGVSVVEDDDGALMFDAEPYIHITVSGAAGEIDPGTEVWI